MKGVCHSVAINNSLLLEVWRLVKVGGDQGTDDLGPSVCPAAGALPTAVTEGRALSAVTI